MQALRRAHWITRFVLVWFALFIGVAVASPLAKSSDVQMVCSAMGGMKMVVAGDESPTPVVSASMDCPLCASVAPPTPTALGFLDVPVPMTHAPHPVVAARIVSATAPPLPSRGPPGFPL